MKILHIITTMNPVSGGPIEGINKLIGHYSNLGVQAEIAVVDDPDNSPWLSEVAVPIHALGPSVFKYAYSSRLLPWLKSNAKHYDAVIVNGLWQYTGYAAWKALHGTNTPYFVFTHGMLDPWFKHTYPLKHLKKWLYWPWAEYRVLRDANAVIFTCEEERLLARESFWLYRANEAVTAYGTDTPPHDAGGLSAKFLDQFPQCKGKRIALFLSRIHEKKGCDLLIEAFAKVCGRDERLHLVMAGPDDSIYAQGLKSQAKSLGVENRITWTGMLQGDLKWGGFHACEVFCLSSHQENFGIVVAEALACGKPTLITNKVNIWREIEEDRAGLVSNDDLAGTVSNLEAWLALSADEYLAMQTRARACFEQRFHIKRAAARLIEIIEKHK